jgi:hypothetical protein
LLAAAASAPVGHAGAAVRLEGGAAAVPVVWRHEDQAVSLPPAAQTLIDQLVHVLGMQALPLESLAIHFDKDHVAQSVKPQLNFRRKKDKTQS